MHPVLLSFEVGETEIVLRAYSTFYTLAWVVALAAGTAVAARRGFTWWKVLLIFAAALALGIVGARALDLGVNWSWYAEDPSRIYDVGFRGFALYGGLVLALATAALLGRKFHLPVWRLADSAVPGLVAGIVLMRVGCFLNGCCFGTTTGLPWGVVYPLGSPAWAHQVATGQIGLLDSAVLPVHPTQIYEIIAALVVGTLAVWFMCRRDPEGQPRSPDGLPFLVFALGFTAFRAFNHLLRAQMVSVTMPRWAYPAFYAVVCAAVAVIILTRTRRKSRTGAAETATVSSPSSRH